jgi:UPF0755 protein
MRRSFRIILTLVALFACAVSLFWVGYTAEYDLGERTATIIVKPGDGFSAVRKAIAEQKIGTYDRILKYAAILRSVDKRLTPGRYDFTGKVSIKIILDKLSTADFVRIKVTIPEGSTIWSVASILQQRMGLDSAYTVSLNSNSEVLGALRLPSLEGYLYPETYFIPWGSTIESVVSTMVDQFRAATDTIWPERIQLDLSPDEVVILASIIESETSLESEHGLVASVYSNRLREGMKLDADPTVIYGLNGLERPLYRKDLHKDTPYNTYLHKGLPPTAINSPSLASIKAALSPDSSDFYYFVADETGGHRFSRTLREHNRAIREIRGSD